MSHAPLELDAPSSNVAPDVARTAVYRRLAFLCGTALAIGALPFAWQRTFGLWRTMGVLFPRNTLFLLAMIALVAGLMLYSRRRFAPRTTWLVVAVGLAVWCVYSGILWSQQQSSLAASPATLAFATATSLWLFWLWAAPLLASRAIVRWGVLLALAAIVPLEVWLVRADGFDGDGRVLYSWRYGAERTLIAARRPATGSLSTDTAGQCGEYRGSPRRDGVVTGAKLARDWLAQPPRELWRIPVGAGWGGFAVAAGQAITQEQRGEQETIVCYDVATGREVWAHEDKVAFRSELVGDGPRATPTIAGDRVVTLGGTGLLNCLDRATGDALWSVDILKDNDAELNYHGMSGSPLVVDDLVIASAGGKEGRSLAAYRLADGERVWRAGSDPAGYASPQLTELAGVRQVLMMNATGLAAHDPTSGRVLWTFAWTNDQFVNCSQPLRPPGDDARLLLSSGYGKGATLLDVASADGELRASPLWESRNLKTKFTSAVLHGNFAYGLDDGILSCIDLADGSRRWKRGRYGHGQLLLAGDLLVVQAEQGHVVLVAADPEHHQELAILTALNSKTWNHPALAGRLLVVRNDREAACFELPAAE